MTTAIAALLLAIAPSKSISARGSATGFGPSAIAAARPGLPLPAARLPQGFVQVELASGMNEPTDFAFLPGGRALIALRDGVVFLYKDGALAPDPVLDIGARVDSSDQRGLLGIAIDPNFQDNGYFYVIYVYQHDGAPEEGTKTNRLSRFTVVGEVADPSSERVLLGSVNGDSCNNFPAGTDCLPADGRMHFGGALAFAADGTLFLTTGDGALASDFDNALRAQDLDLLPGKLLHVTTDGEGLPSNPFFTGDPLANRSKVWAYGLRNPFRASIDPLSGLPFVGDVGFTTWEEVNVVQPGSNLGWPCFEGLDHNPTFGDMPPCQAMYAQLPANLVWPAFSYRNKVLGNSVIGGPVYRGAAFPAELQNTYFFADFGKDAIFSMRVDEAGAPISAPVEFADGLEGPVSLKVGPDESLYFLSLWEGELLRIDYVGGDVPFAATSPLPSGGVMAEYFSNVGLEGQPVTRRFEEEIDHAWSESGPGAWLAGNAFSVRWTGRHVFESGEYDFSAIADDGVRVWLDDEPIIDAWLDQPPTEYRATRAVEAGEHRVVVEYYNSAGAGAAQVRWELPAPSGSEPPATEP